MGDSDRTVPGRTAVPQDWTICGHGGGGGAHLGDHTVAEVNRVRRTPGRRRGRGAAVLLLPARPFHLLLCLPTCASLRGRASTRLRLQCVR